MTYQKSFSVVKNVFLAIVAVCFLASCQDDEIVGSPEVASTSSAVTEESNISSLTVEGENTNFTETVECSSCTYVVDANSELIDGDQLGLKAGSVICLDAAKKYGNLSFINLRGTDQNPIVIANTTFAKN